MHSAGYFANRDRWVRLPEAASGRARHHHVASRLAALCAGIVDAELGCLVSSGVSAEEEALDKEQAMAAGEDAVRGAGLVAMEEPEGGVAGGAVWVCSDANGRVGVSSFDFAAVGLQGDDHRNSRGRYGQLKARGAVGDEIREWRSSGSCRGGSHPSRRRPHPWPRAALGRSGVSYQCPGPRSVVRYKSVSDALLYPGAMAEKHARAPRPTRDEVRERLIEAAGDALAEVGFDASVEEITERAGFSRGAFYSNYSSKEEVFLEAFQRRTHQRIADLQERLEGSADLASLLQRLNSRRPAGSHREFANYMQLYFHCLAHPGFRRHLAAAEHARRDAIREALERLLPAVTRSQQESATLARLLAALDDGLAIQTYLHGKREPLDTTSILALAEATSSTQ